MASTGDRSPGYHVVQAEMLRGWSRQVLVAAGAPEADSDDVAASLIEADLRGVQSHGMAILPIYARGVKQELINPRPKVSVVAERGAMALLDGDRGLGQIASAAAMRLAIEKAREHVIGAVTVRNSNHFGATAHWAMMALPHGMIGFATTNASPIMAPWGGASRALGNNPLAYAIPAGKEHPLVIDFGMSTVAYGKVRVARDKGEKIPLGWAVDKEGNPTDDPAAAMLGVMTAVGGHKGSGLAMAMEALSAVASGATFTTHLPVGGNIDALPHQDLGHFFWALDVSFFMPVEEFGRRMDDMIATQRAAKLAPGFERILMPGEPEFQMREARLREGIPLPSGTWDRLAAVGREMGVVPLD